MKILILGAGGVGGYFGAHLANAGVDVTFLVRAKRALQLRERGLIVRTLQEELRLVPKLVETGHACSEQFDVVILSCKAYDLASSIHAITPYISNATVVLPLLNGIRHLEILDKAFGSSRVLGGLAQVSTTLLPTGEIQQFTATQVLIYGARDASQVAIAERLHEAIKNSKFDARLSQNITLEMWEKFLFLATLAGATCLLRADIGEIVRTTHGTQLVMQLLDDCAATASAEGYAPREKLLEMARSTLTQPGSALQASMRRDMEQGHTTEADHVLGDMLNRATNRGIDSLLLRTAYCHMQAHEQRLAFNQRSNT
jgi:2-dehydropantoate 2-reductase